MSQSQLKEENTQQERDIAERVTAKLLTASITLHTIHEMVRAQWRYNQFLVGPKTFRDIRNMITQMGEGHRLWETYDSFMLWGVEMIRDENTPEYVLRVVMGYKQYKDERMYDYQ